MTDRDITLKLRTTLFEAKRAGIITSFRLRSGPRAQGWRATLYFRDEEGRGVKVYTTSALGTLEALRRLERRLGAPK